MIGPHQFACTGIHSPECITAHTALVENIVVAHRHDRADSYTTHTEAEAVAALAADIETQLAPDAMALFLAITIHRLGYPHGEPT